MFIECIKNNGTEYLRVIESYRANENSNSKCRRKVVRNIGPLSRYDDGKPDYLNRLRQSFKVGNPLIESLIDLIGDRPFCRQITIKYDLENETDCFSDPKNIGYFLLDALYDSLGIYDVLNKHKSATKIEYDLNGISKILIFGRLLEPDSKVSTFEGRKKYAFDVTSSDDLIEVYRALDVLDEKSRAIGTRMNHKIKNTIGRNTEICFYDVTNYYFETKYNDEDIVDAAGCVIREGLRKKGHSKEKRSEPIVQMGLFIDDNGIPISYQLFPGNNIDQTTLRPALKKSIDKLNFGKVIVVADGGLNSDKNIAHILHEGNGYIVSKSLKKSTKAVKDWILEESGYEWNEKKTFKVKSQIRNRTITDENGKKVEITEKLVCFWSKKHYDKQLKENATFIEYLNTVIRCPEKLKGKTKKIEKFLKKTVVDKDTGEIVDTETCLSIDRDKIQEYLNLLGYYTIMTSELYKTDREIIDKYRGLSRIEDSFRITKSDLEGRPVYVRNPKHINAHFLICFIALTMIRLIQFRILKYQGKSTLNENGWESGLTAERIMKALVSFQADLLPGGRYRLTRLSDDLKMILESFHINADLRMPTTTELRTLKYDFDRAGII